MAATNSPPWLRKAWRGASRRRARLGPADGARPPVRFSVGLSCLEVDGDAEAAVSAADAAMYTQKKDKRRTGLAAALA